MINNLVNEGTLDNFIAFNDWTSGSYANTFASIESLKSMYEQTVVLVDIEGSREIDYVFENTKPAFVIIAANPEPADHAFLT